MRLESRVLPALAAALLLPAAPSFAQVVEVSGGASTAYSAQGATVVVHGSQSESSIGIGILNGRLGVGGASTRRIAGGTMTLGQQGFSLELPTDLFDTGHAFFGAGLGVQRAYSSHRTLTAFLGGSSQEGGSPLFRSANLGSFSSFAQWKQPVSKRCTSWSTVLQTSAVSAIESVQCSPSRRLTLGASLGVGAGAPYAAASVILKQRRFDLQAALVEAGSNFRRNNSDGLPSPEPIRENVAGEWRPTRAVSLSWRHGNYLLPAGGTFSTQGPSTLTGESTLDEAGLALHGHATWFAVTVLHSATKQTTAQSGGSIGNAALSAAFSRSLGRAVWTETLLSSFVPAESRSYTLINGVSLNVNSHLRLSEQANVGAGGTTFSHGGALLLPFSTFSADYQLVYVAGVAGNPFRQTLVGNMEVHLVRDLALHASSSIGPTGTALYTVQLSTLWARDHMGKSSSLSVSLGASVLRGRVVDVNGNPVVGAALLIDAQPLYTDSSGVFLFREKRAAVHSLTVLPGEFLDIGEYRVLSAPSQIRTTNEASGQWVRIVVARKGVPPSSPGSSPTHQPVRQP